MGFHTDQALDLKDELFICLFSCYNDPDTKSLRKLVVKNKSTNNSFDIKLEHNSVIIFSVKTNREYLHKIILDSSESKDLWIGATFRYSKTSIYFSN